MPLTDEQRTAVESEAENRLFLAGPGTGKSTTILGFVRHAIEVLSVSPQQIYILTFTRTATAELKSKVAASFGNLEAPPAVFTIHGFALRQVLKNSRRVSSLPSDFVIADDFDERHIIQEDLKRMLGIDRIREVQELLQKLSSNWETLNADRTDWVVTFDKPEFVGAWQEHRQVYGYALRAELVCQLKKLLEQQPDAQIDGPIGYLVVDEYQDLNKCELRVIQELNGRGSRLVCAGDDDQSIYGFRFAYPEGIRSFSTDHPSPVEFKFTECFRCDELILELAHLIIRQDYRRIPKELVSMSGERGQVRLLRFVDQSAEASGVASIITQLSRSRDVQFGQIVILLRSDNKGVFSSPLISSLSALGIPVQYRQTAQTLLDGGLGRYLSALVKLALNPNHDLALRSILDLTPGIGPATVEAIYGVARTSHKRFSQVCREVSAGQHSDVNNIARANPCLDGILSVNFGAIAADPDLTNALRTLASGVPGVTEVFAQSVVLLASELHVTTLEAFAGALADFLEIDHEPEPEVDAVRIMTMHQAKGLSADAVIVVAAEEEYLPGRGDPDEERRLLYVSVTRARHFLFLTRSLRRTGRQSHTGYTTGSSSSRHLSRFLAGLPIREEDGSTFSLT
jgi:DNA helicase II / ATP-dependent DNA helicase PcrA